MASINDINKLPTSVKENTTNHLNHHNTIHSALKDQAPRLYNAEQAAIRADERATSAEATVNAHTPRVDALEAMNGVSPESPVDGQTANLISQPDTLTRAALMDVGNETFLSKRAAVHSTFSDTPDGTLPTHTDSGHEWGYFVAGDMEVRNGYLRSKQDGIGSGSHAEVSLDGPVTRMGAVFRFNSEGGTRTERGGLAINAWADGGIAANGGGRRTSAHVDMTRSSCGLGVRAVEGAGGTIHQVGGRYTFPTPLEVDKWYTLEWYISGDTAVVVMPDGHLHFATDPRIQSIPATFADFQPRSPGDDEGLITEVRQVWADSAPMDSDSSGSMAFQALATAAEGEPPTPNGKYLQFYDRDGEPQDVLGKSIIDTVILRNGSATQPRAEMRLLKSGGIDFAVDGRVPVTIRPDGRLYISKIAFSSGNHAMSLGSGSPEGVNADAAGSLYVQFDGRRGQILWQREVAGPGNTGWQPVGHPMGFTSQRPASPAVGLSYFDRSIGQPIWWNGTIWVDAMGVDIDAPPPTP